TQAWTGFSDKPAYHDAQGIAHALAEAYANEEVDSVLVVYNAFVSPLVQRVTVTEILPVPLETIAGEQDRDERSHPLDFFFEPEPRQILARLLPVYVETEIYRALLESAASEQGARMTAMRNASKSAGELIDNLTLAMNRARQAEITQEILEVVAGADALTTSRISCVISACRARSEEHTSELQSRENIVCRLLLEKKKKKANGHVSTPT